VASKAAPLLSHDSDGSFSTACSYHSPRLVQHAVFPSGPPSLPLSLFKKALIHKLTVLLPAIDSRETPVFMGAASQKSFLKLVVE
jgi:hypothetical protein